MFEFLVGEGDQRRVEPFPSARFTLGSDAACEVRFEPSLVKPRHAEVLRDERGHWWIRDLTESNSVAVNGTPVLEERLENGAQIAIGRVKLAVRERPNVGSGEKTALSPELKKKRDELEPETVIDRRYRITRRIATGGMGEVYHAVHVELGKQLALKVMLPELSRDQDFVGRFKREAIAASRIGQQNIVDISDFGSTEDGRFYFVMEYIEGRTLASLLRREGAFAWQRVVHVGLQVARALAAAHVQRIVHRDLKPENIMLLQRPGQPDFVKVLDFGIAKVISTNGTMGGLTAIGMVVGTPQYMAPEQAAGLSVDGRADVYALGLILHELINGHPCFTGDSPPVLMAMQMAADPPPLAVKVPEGLEQLVFKMLSKKTDARPQTMEEVVAVLDDLACIRTPTAKTAPDMRAIPDTRPKASAPPVGATRAAPMSLAPLPLTGIMNEMEQAAVKTTVPTPAAPTVVDRNVQTVTPVMKASPPPAERSSQPDDDLAVVKKSRLPLVVGVVATLAVGVVAAAVLSSREEERPAPVESAKPVAEKRETPAVVPAEPSKDAAKPDAAVGVKLTLTSTPERVEVYEEDILLGNTPVSLTRAQGHVSDLRFELKGYTTLKRKVRFESDNTIVVELERAGTARPATVKKQSFNPPPVDDLKDLPE